MIKIFNTDTFFDCILSLLIFVIMILIVSSPKTFTSATISGLTLFFTAVLPGLFPFMLLTKLLTEIGVVFKLSKKCDRFSRKVFGCPGVSMYALTMSVVSGYPIGAKIIGDLHEKRMITDDDARKMSVFCTTSGPIFVIGTVGTIMFNNFNFGLILYASHILSSLLLGVLSNLFSKNKSTLSPAVTDIQAQKRSKNLITSCLTQTVNSLFVVGAYITLFYLITELLEYLSVFDMVLNLASPLLRATGADPSLAKGVIYGILEVTRGARELSQVGAAGALILTSGILSFSGLSIIMQSMAFLKPAGVKTSKFIMVKIVHALLSSAICALLILLI